jgi:hypothetical protein
VTALHELGLAAAARATQNREVSSETYVGTLLERARIRAWTGNAGGRPTRQIGRLVDLFNDEHFFRSDVRERRRVGSPCCGIRCQRLSLWTRFQEPA